MEVDYSKQPGLIPAHNSDYGQLQHGLTPETKGNEADTPAGYGSGLSQTEPIGSEHRIFGLQATVFWLLLALVVVVIGAAVGGGVGGSIAVNNAKTQCLHDAATNTASTSATPTTSSSSASSTALPAGTTRWGPLQTTVPYTGCPQNNGTTYTSSYLNKPYKIYCGLDIPNTGTSDLMRTITPTFQLCIEACSSWNDLGKGNGGVTKSCVGVAFIPSHVNGDETGAPSDCVLKANANAWKSLVPNSAWAVDSALIITS